MFSSAAAFPADANEPSNNRDLSLNSHAEQEICSEEHTTCELYYEEDGVGLNDAPLNDDGDDDDDDDKNEKDDNNSTLCESEVKSKEDSSLEDVDIEKEHALLELCAEFMTHSLPDNKKNSLSSDEDFSSDEDSSSSDSDDDYGMALKRHGNFTDLQHPYDYPQSASSQRIKNFVVRGIDAHSSSDIKFCRKVPDNRKKHGTSDSSISSAVRDVIANDKSDVISEVHAESGKRFMDMILASEEYIGIQDNLENTKLYKDHCYKLSLKKNPRRKEAVLLEVLPTLIESTSLEDVSDEYSDGGTYRTGNQEVVSHNEQEPVIRKMKQPKRRFNAIRKWFSKTFCCCCTSKDPP